MFLSVNIPVYNCEKYLRECIESILAQNFADFEIILADDGSTDLSGAICDEYAAKDQRIKVLHLEHCGVIVARKHAHATSSGEYILCMDADDCIAPELFERMYDICKVHEPDMLAFDFETMDYDEVIRNKNGFPEGLYVGSSLSKVRHSLIYDKYKWSFNYGGIIYSLWSKVIRRDFWDKYFPILPKEITKGEDMVATVVMTCSAKSIYFMDFCGYKYRITSGSIMNTFKESEIKNYRMVYKFITLKVPSISKNSIAVWLMYMFLNYCRDAIKVATSDAEFENIINRNTDTEFFAILNSARLYLPKPNDIKLMHLVKRQHFKALYSTLKEEGK